MTAVVLEEGVSVATATTAATSNDVAKATAEDVASQQPSAGTETDEEDGCSIQ